jgi:hypothetical protein
MLRVIGYASAPQMLGVIRCIGGVVGWIWSLVAGFIAVRQGLDLYDANACLTIIFGFGLYLIGAIIIGILIGGFFWFL